MGVWESGGPKEAMASATGAREPFKSPRDKSRRGPFSGFQYVGYKLALAKNSCQQLNNNMGICHVQPQRLNPVPLQLLTFNTPGESSGCSEALWAPRKLVQQLFR